MLVNLELRLADHRQIFNYRYPCMEAVKPAIINLKNTWRLECYCALWLRKFESCRGKEQVRIVNRWWVVENGTAEKVGEIHLHYYCHRQIGSN